MCHVIADISWALKVSSVCVCWWVPKSLSKTGEELKGKQCQGREQLKRARKWKKLKKVKRTVYIIYTRTERAWTSGRTSAQPRLPAGTDRMPPPKKVCASRSFSESIPYKCLLKKQRRARMYGAANTVSKLERKSTSKRPTAQPPEPAGFHAPAGQPTEPSARSLRNGPCRGLARHFVDRLLPGPRGLSTPALGASRTFRAAPGLRPRRARQPPGRQLPGLPDGAGRTHCCTALPWRSAFAAPGSWTAAQRGCSCPGPGLAPIPPASLAPKTSSGWTSEPRTARELSGDGGAARLAPCPGSPGSPEAGIGAATNRGPLAGAASSGPRGL